MTPENSAHSKMIKCKGKINPQNGRCDKCFQLAMTSGNDCDRMIPYIEESKPSTAQEKPDFEEMAENYVLSQPKENRSFSHDGWNATGFVYAASKIWNDYVEPLQKENEQLQAEVERLNKLNKPIP